MARIRVMIDVEVEAEHLMQREVGVIANSIVKVVNGPKDGKPEWFTEFCKNAKFEPKAAKIWSVERLPDEPKPEELKLDDEIEKE